MTTPSSSTHTAYRPASHVRSRAFGGDLVLLDLAGDIQYALNELGAHVWNRAMQGASTTAIVDTIVAEYLVDEKEARTDVELVLRQLIASGLIVPSETMSAPAP